MELMVNKIPDEFLHNIPPGFRLVQKNDNNFLLLDSLFCPHGHKLIVDSVRIHDEPSIKIDVTINRNRGSIFIDAFWGSHAKLYSFIPGTVNGDTFVEAFCPYCGISLIENFNCKQELCDSDKSILLLLPELKGKIHVCAKLGCPGHVLEVENMPMDLVDSISKINFFGEDADKIFGGYNELFAD